MLERQCIGIFESYAVYCSIGEEFENAQFKLLSTINFVSVLFLAGDKSSRVSRATSTYAYVIHGSRHELQISRYHAIRRI